MIRYRLANEKEFRTHSSAASSLMGGKVVNGWHFWSLPVSTPTDQKPAAHVKAALKKKVEFSKPKERTLK